MYPDSLVCLCPPNFPIHSDGTPQILTKGRISKDSDLVFIRLVYGKSNILNDSTKLRTFVYLCILS